MTQRTDMLTPHSRDPLLEQAHEMEKRRQPFVLATVVRCESPASAKPGAKALVTERGIEAGWIGGGCTQPIVAKVAKESLISRKPALIRITPNANELAEEGVTQYKMSCHSGGTLDIFIDPFVPAASVLVIGISHTAVKFAELASALNFSVTIAFPDVDRKHFPTADAVLNSLESDHLKATRRHAIAVVATQGNRDEAGLEAALASGAPYIALVASERKAQKLRSHLLEKGHAREQVEAIKAPAGVEIGATTPEEIALSILAGLVKACNDGTLSTESTTHAESASLAASEEAVDLVCAMIVNRATAEHTSKHNGHLYYFCNFHCKQQFDADPHSYIKKTEQAGTE